MPIKRGNKLVELREEVVKGLEREYQIGLRSAPDFTTFVNNLLLDVIRREEFLAKYKPFSHLNYAGSHAGSLFIRDIQRNVIAEITYKDELLYCNSPDSSSDCDHTRFATSLIDVAKYLQEK
ncbi:MAG TPA: hypothetical protein VH796_12335 [Nitrososphaeraceae archaeon]|jgi:hypothetical protein